MRQLIIYSALIRSLRELDYENIVFEFNDPDDMHGPPDELSFYQLCYYNDDLLRVEVRLGPTDDWRLYAKECSADEAISLLHEINRTRAAPSLEGWRDITDKLKDWEIIGEEDSGEEK